MSRRRILAGAAALVAGGVVGAAAPALLPDADTRLLALSAEALAASAREAAAYEGQRPGDDTSEAKAEAAARVAFAEWEAALLAMAAIPAAGLPGVAAKVMHLLRALDVGEGDADEVLADSLGRDIARLVPLASAK